MKTRRLSIVFKYLIVPPLLLLSSGYALADSTSVASVMSQNLDATATIFIDMSILFGVCMIVGALARFKKCAEGRNMMSGQASMAGPFFMLLAGICFMMLPEVIDSSLLSTWGTISDAISMDSGSQEPWAQYQPVIEQFIRLIGVGSFMRCLFLMAKSGSQGQQGTGGKALIHFFSAVLCIHIDDTYYLIQNFFGIGS